MAEQDLGRLGVIGLGMVGSHYARHLQAAAGRVVVYDRDPARLAAATAAGATAAASPAEVARGADVMVLSLPSPEASRAVMLADDGVLAGAGAGALVIDASTIDPETCIALYAAAKARGVGYLETPISGGEPGEAGTEGAAAATVTFMVGGDEADFERARPALGVLGSHTLYLGPAGSGSIAKLISNQIAGLINLVMAEAFTLGAAAGFGYEELLDVFALTDARSFMLTEYIAPRLRRRDFEPGFTCDLMYKDHRLAAELAHRLGVPMPLNALALETYQSLRATGGGGKDLTEVINLLGRLGGADIYRPRPREGA